MTLAQRTKRKPKRKPKSKKTNGPKGTSMNGPKIDGPKGISLNENHPLKTFKTRKTNAMRKRGLNFKGKPLGTSLNFRPKLSLKNLIQQRRNQDQRKNLKNTKTFKDRKKNALAKILENVAQSKERNTSLRELRRMEPEEDPEKILAREKKENEKRIEKEYRPLPNFYSIIDGLKYNQPNMKGAEPDIVKELTIASRNAELSGYRAKINQTEPKNNSNVPDFRGRLAKKP